MMGGVMSTEGRVSRESRVCTGNGKWSSPRSLDTLHSFLLHRSNRTRQNSDNLVQQFESFLNNCFSKPMLHSFVAPTCLTSRTSRDIEKPNVLCAAESSITLFDICTDRIRAAYLLGNQSETPVISFEVLHVSYHEIKKHSRFLIRTKLFKTSLAHRQLLSCHSSFDIRHSTTTLVTPLDT